MKFKNMKHYPFFTAIIATIFLFTLIGYLGKNNVYAGYSVDWKKAPQLAVVFEGIKDKTYPWKTAWKKEDGTAGEKKTAEGNNKVGESETAEGNSKAGASETAAGNNKAGESGTGKEKNRPGKNNGTEESSTAGKGKTEGKKDPVNKTDKNDSGPGAAGSPVPDNNTQNPSGKDNSGTLPGGKQPDKPGDTPEKPEKEDGPSGHKGDGQDKTYSFVKVKEDYFDDALFIGDSRTVGLSEYSGWDKPTYYADVGLTIYSVFEKEIAEINGKKMTVDKALKKQSFQKIYIMLGINELGRGTTKTFIEEYKKVIGQIRKLQPEAVIFVEGIMKVSKKKSDSDPIFNNKNIQDKNDHLALLADNKKIFYIDVNEAITDETGGIPAKYTFDNIHLKAAYYSIWTDFLQKHGIVRE